MPTQELISRIVKVERSRSPQEALKATGCNLYINDKVVTHMPKVESDETEVIFFKVGRWLTDEELAQEYELRCLKTTDPYSLAKINEDDHSFSDKYPNATIWSYGYRQWCFMAFANENARRNLKIDLQTIGWNEDWWFAGARK